MGAAVARAATDCELKEDGWRHVREFFNWTCGHPTLADELSNLMNEGQPYFYADTAEAFTRIEAHAAERGITLD